MNKYIGKICPYCKVEFRYKDDIVVCSACDMPHHKDCWVENQGCTTFGCLGTIKNVDGSPNSVTSTEIHYDDVQAQNTGTIYCTRCGAPNNMSFSFCGKCGNSLSTNQSQAQSQAQSQTQNAYNYQQMQYNSQQNNYSVGNGYNQSNIYTNQNNYNQQTNNGYNQNNYSQQTNNGYNQNNYSQQTNNGYNQNYYGQAQNTDLDPDIIQLIGTKTEYYVPRFQEFKMQNKKNSWNWAAFWITPYWFLYRKMYGLGFGILAGAFVLSLIPGLSFLSLAGYIVLAIFANYIYMKQLENKAQQARYMHEPMKSQFMLKNSGANVVIPIVTSIAFVFLVIMFS